MTTYMTPEQVRAEGKSKGRQVLCRKFDTLIANAGLPKPVEEFAFHPERKWRFDRAWPDSKLAVEIDGGVFTQGRHVRPYGVVGDNEKIAEAQRLGWTVLRYTAIEIESRPVLKGKRKGCQLFGYCFECKFYVKRQCFNGIGGTPRNYYGPPVSPVEQIRQALIHKPDEEIMITPIGEKE